MGGIASWACCVCAKAPTSAKRSTVHLCRSTTSRSQDLALMLILGLPFCAQRTMLPSWWTQSVSNSTREGSQATSTTASFSFVRILQEDTHCELACSHDAKATDSNPSMP